MATVSRFEITKDRSRRLDTSHLAPEVRSEIERFKREIERIERGEADPDDFKRFRLQNGVYGIRGTQDMHMVRVKIIQGDLTSDQLQVMADIAEELTPHQIGHLTTRQNIQFHHIQRKAVPEILLRIANCGLTTREACGNTVRNVTSCQYAGIAPDEVFDVTPYADALARHLLRNPINQNLPRKFKITFEGCPEDHARTSINDLGCIAALRERDSQVERGFKIYVGGGLGAQPRAAELLEPFTPADMLIPTAEAVIRVFDRHGERRPQHTYRMRSRLKFLIKAWGFEKLRREILIERRAIVATRSGLSDYHIEPDAQRPPNVAIWDGPPRGWRWTKEYQRWLDTNTFQQRQRGWYAVTVRCPLGDISADKLRTIAEVARTYCGGRVRITIAQNLLLRWVPESALPRLYQELSFAGLALSEAGRVSDITRCPGADTCQLAITHSRGLAQSLTTLFSNGLSKAPEVENLAIKISGCMNSCGHHHIADLGFYGASRKVDNRDVPEYIMLVGGGTAKGEARFGKSVAHIPARLVPDATRRLLNHYRENRLAGESFSEFVDRVEVKEVRNLLADFTKVPSYMDAPDIYRDLGDDAGEFRAEIGQGECAS